MRHPILLLILCTFLLIRNAAWAEEIVFYHNDTKLSGFHLAPDQTEEIKGVILFIHGDGPVPYDAHDYYTPIWTALRETGYGIFSWDKPGIGGSEGNWLDQTMIDRQNEVRSALTFIKKYEIYHGKKIGLLGFSQAGWVAPAVAQTHPDVNFLIGIGFAINWLEQSWYLTKTRLEKEGAQQKEIERAFKEYTQERTFWESDPAYPSESSLSPERFNFVKKNVFSDSIADFERLTKPAFILLGAEDQNVNVQNTYEKLKDHPSTQIRLFENATHALLKHSEFGDMEPGLSFWLKLAWQEEDAFAEGVLHSLTDWLSLQ